MFFPDQENGSRRTHPPITLLLDTDDVKHLLKALEGYDSLDDTETDMTVSLIRLLEPIVDKQRLSCPWGQKIVETD